MRQVAKTAEEDEEHAAVEAKAAVAETKTAKVESLVDRCVCPVSTRHASSRHVAAHVVVGTRWCNSQLL